MSTLRVGYLTALGLEPLVLRVVAGDAADAVPVDVAPTSADDAAKPVSTATDAAPTTRARSDASRERAPQQQNDDAGLFAPQPARLCFLLDIADADDASHQRLLRAIALAAGVSPAQLAHEAREGLPMIAFGLDASHAIAAPAPAALRNARAKRALWPALRRLRRTLRTTP